VCSTGMLFNERSQSKFYSCQLTDPGVAKIVGPVLPLHCTTGGQKGDKGGGSAMSGECDCSVEVVMKVFLAV
jgi:hypothetical protein